MAERPLYTLYKNLKAQNFDVPDDYNKFESALTRDGKSGADNRHAIYENLKAQNFDVPDTYERFYSALFEPRSKTSSRAKGGSVPMSAADRARYLSVTQSVLNTDRQVKRASGNIRKTVERAKKFNANDGKVTIGFKNPLQNKNVQKNEFNYNSKTGKTGTYTTTDGVEFDNEYDASQHQNKLDKYGEEWNKAVDMGIVPSELDKADPDLSDTDVAMRQMERRQEWLNENQNRRSKELNESMHLQGSPFVASGGAVAPSSFNTAISNEANRLSDVEYGAYNTAKAYNQMLRTTLLQELKEQKQRNENAGWWKDKWNDVSNYFGGMLDTMFDPKLFSQGVMDAAISNNLLQVKKGMEDGTINKGSNAGNAAQAMLGAIQQQQGESAKQQQNGAKAYQYGDMSGRSLKFMGDFLTSGWRNVMTTGFTKAGEKVGEKMALGTLGKWFTKNTGRVLGDMAGSAALAATNQLGSTYNNVIERYVGMNNENGGVTQDKNGDLKFNEGVSLGKAIKDGFGSATIENFSEMFGEYLPGASKLLSKLGLSKVSSFFEKIGNNAYYKWLSNATNKSGIQGVMSEIAEEEFGTALHAAWGDGGGSWSDFNVFTNPDAREKQIDTCLGMFYSVGFMQSPRTAVGAINAVQYFKIKHQVNKADKFGQMMFNDKWDEIKSKIDVTTNTDLTKTVLDATRSDSMTAKQKGAVINYAMFLSKLRGFNQASDAKTKDKVEEGDTAPTLSNYLDDAYTEGHNADDADKHDIQIQHEDQAKTLAAALGISEQQLSGMSDEELESLTGQDDKLDQAIYDYQLSSARYQGVVDDAQDKVDLAAHQAAQKVDMYTDQSRGSVRNATIKASGGAEDYGVYIISGNIATYDDGSIDVSNSDDMILYYDPTTNSVEHADALMFTELGEELPADDVKAQAVADAKENAIKEVAGIIDGTVEVGSQLNVTDTDGTEHTYEVLADYGDGTAAISIDGNVVENPYSLADLQQMKDLEDQKRLESAKAEREQIEKKRDAQQTQETEETQPSFDFNQILNDDGNVVLVDVLDKDGNTKYPDSKLFLIRDAGAKAKVVELKSDGTLVPHAVNKEDVATISSMSLDEYKQAMPESSMIEENSGQESDEDSQLANLGLPKGSEIWMSGDGFGRPKGKTLSRVVGIDEQGSIILEDKDGKKWYASFDYINNHRELPPLDENTKIVNEENNQSESNAEENTPAPEQTPAITLEDGTIVPILEDGNPDFSKLTAAQTAELYDSQFGEDAESVISSWVSDAKKALDKANNMTVKGKTFVEQKASKDAKEKAIADAQAAYDSAIAIRDAYNERQLAKVEDTAEGRKALIEKARRKFARLKSAVKDDAEAVAQIYKETVGSLLHRLYDGTGIDVTDTIPLTAEEYVASNLGAHSLNYEGTETSKSVKQETGLSREDFAKTQLLAADGKGTTIDALVHRLWDNRPSNLDSLDTQDIRNALIGVLTSGFKASEARSYIENIRIAQAEKLIEEERTAAENAAYYEQQKAKEVEEKKKAELEKKAEEEKKKAELKGEETNPLSERVTETDEEFESDGKYGTIYNKVYLIDGDKRVTKVDEPDAKGDYTGSYYMYDGKRFGDLFDVADYIDGKAEQTKFPDKLKDGSEVIEVPGDATDEKPFGEQLDESDLPFSAKESGKQQTTSERAADVEKNKVDDMKVVDNIIGQKTRKAFERLAKMMCANIQWQYSDKLGNGWIQETTDADGNVHRTIFITLDSSITEGAQFIFGHEMTHQIKNLNPAAYNELTQLVLDTYGSDAFDKAVDETMKRYSDAGFSGRSRDYYAEEVVADAVGEMIRDLNLAHTLAMKMSHPLLAAIHEILQKIKLAFFGTEYSDVTKNIIRSIEQAYVKTANREAIDAATQEGEGGQRLSLRTKPEPKKTQKVYKLMRLGEDGKLYPLFIGSGEAIELGKWYDADSPKLQDLTSLSSKDYVGTRTAKKDGASVKEEYHYGAYIVNNKTGEAMSLADFKAKYSKQFARMGNNPNKKAVDWATDNGYRWIKIEEKNHGQSRYGGEARSYYNYGINGSGSVSIFAMRPGWHAGSLPTMRQIGKGSAKNLRDDTFVWVEGEIPAEIDYNEEAQKNADKDIPDHIPTDGYYLKATNANKEASQADKVGWYVAGAFRANRIMSDKETRDIIDEWNAAHPGDNVEYDWKRESGKDFNSETMSLEDTPKFSLKVYHGSGADFTEFDFDHMGEGVGSQAFGWGGYVTSSKKIGKSYADLNRVRNLPEDIFDTENKKAAASYVQKLITQGYDKESAIQEVRSKYDGFLDNLNHDDTSRKNNGVAILNLKERIATLDEIEDGKLPLPTVSLYEVDIPDDNGSNYIEFYEDATPEFKEQIKSVLAHGLPSELKEMPEYKEAERKFYEENGTDESFEKSLIDDGLFELEHRKSNGDAYNALSVAVGDKLASKILSSLGYTGIKYPAGTIMGGAEENDTNYVIFKPEDMKITEHTKFSLRLKAAIEETETNPSDAQKESGNYKKGHIKFGGYDYTIENPKGSTRSGKDSNGKEWKVTMHDTYGYIRGKFGKDGDHLDMFINDKADLDNWNGDVFVVDQVNPDGSFDEHKVMYGYDSMDDAKNAYLANYSKGWKGLGNITGASKAEFDKWLDTSNRKLKSFADYAKVKFSQDQPVGNDEPKTFEEFLNHPLLKFSIKNEEQRKAAENAYKYAAKLRPNKYAQYAIVDMGMPSKVPEYYEKKVLADNWRRFYNRAVHNELKDVRKKAWGNYKLFDLDRPFAEQVNEVKGDVPDDFNAPDTATSKDNIKGLYRQVSSVAEPRYSLKDEKIKSVAEKFGVNEDDVAMYANAVEKGSTAEAARARANIKRYLLQANEDKISSFKDIIKYTKPINEALKENFGDLDAMIEERRKQVEAQRNAMEAARKRAQEEEEKRQKHLDELSLIPTDELDKRYMDAIDNNDESTAREMLDESARRNGYGDVDSDYQGQGAWAAPSNPQYESDEARRDDIENSPDVNLEDIALGYNLQPDDYFDNPRAYMNNTAYGLESAHVIKNALDAIKNGEKDVKVKVYRAVPTSVKEGKLRNGDWVTPSKKYAEMHGDNRLDGKYRIIEDEVPANQLWWDGNDVNEFGFDDGKEYRYKNAKNNRKLNDLITYDNKGNVIPPSKRFNSRKSDIRFSLKEEKEKIVADAKANGTYMTAPNGEKTKLDAEQWATVRTTNFKNWFGDWENDPENASKVVDENGEPMVMYHYTDENFTIFGKDKEVGKNTFGNASNASYAATTTIGHWFTSNKNQPEYMGKPMACFLNIVEPFDGYTLEGLADYLNNYISDEDFNSYEEDYENVAPIIEAGNNFRKEKIRDGYDGVVIDDEEFGGTSYVAFNANQIKSAENNNGNFSADNDDIRFSLAGERGAAAADKADERTFRMDNLSVAKDMEKNKKKAKAIKAATGWERGADGKWRYEMPDVVLRDPKEWVNKKALTLSDIVEKPNDLFKEYPDLFDAYPELKDMKILKGRAKSGGVFYNNAITLNLGDIREAIKYDLDTHYKLANNSLKKTLVHEIQHYIQEQEGFAKGGNSEMIVDKNALDAIAKLRAEKDAVAKEFYAMSPAEQQKRKYEINNRYNDLTKQIERLEKSSRIGYDGYKRLAGEVEARNVSARLNMTPEERRKTLAESTEDVARKDQIFLGVGDVTFSLRDMADGKESGAADMAEDLKSLNTPDDVDDAIKTTIDDMPSGWKMANKKMIHIAQALGENRKAEIAGEDPKFSLKDGTLIKAGTYFSGGGLVEEGLKGIIDPVVAVEYDEKISGVYRNNFGQHIVTADVRDVDPKELVKQIDGEVEYFHASPVCKNYSQAKSNHAEVELDKETAASTAEFINAIKPKVVTIENVKGYKDSDAMNTITDALDANGYTWDADVYNAADYGGYTNRERLIVRAVRDGKLPAKPEKMAHKSGWYEAVADIIPTLTEKKNGVAPWMDIRLKADDIDWRNIDKPLYVMGSAYADGKVPHAFADELLPTLRTKSGDVIVMPDGKVYRAMGRVLARVSGVSDDYKMPFSENLSHTIIGNGIPTQLTERVIAPLLTGSDPKFSLKKTNNVKDSRIIPTDVNKSVSSQIEKKYDSAIKEVMNKVAERDKRLVSNYIEQDLSDFSKMRREDINQELKSNENWRRKNLREENREGSTYGITDARHRITEATAERELEYRDVRAKYLSETYGLQGGRQVSLDMVDRAFEETLGSEANRGELRALYGKARKVLVQVGAEFGGVVNAKQEGDLGFAGTDRDISLFIDTMTRTSTPQSELAHTILHEMIHQATIGSINLVKKGMADGMLTPKQIEAVNTIINTYDAYKADRRLVWEEDNYRDYGGKDEYEFAAEMADAKQRRILSIPYGERILNAANELKRVGDISLWQAIKNALRRLFEVSDKSKMDKALSDIMDDFNKNIDDISMNNIEETDFGLNGNTRFSLRYDQFEHDLNQWKKDNNLPKDAQRPTIPQRNAGESAVDFLRRVDEYRKQMALWKTAPTYEQHLLSDDTALGEFNRELQKGSVLKRIAFQDSMLAIRKAQEAIMKEVGIDRLNMAEDAYTAENRSHGKGKNEFEEYNNEFLQPLRKAYHQMKKVLGDSYDNVRIYMMAKHGLERDAQMAFKKSLEADYEDVAQRSAAYKAYKGDMNRMGNDSGFELGYIDFNTWRQKDDALRAKYSPSYMNYRYDKDGTAFDYSGLSALFGGSDFEEAASKLVKDIESKHTVETLELWDATNAATKKILRDGYKAGMMSKDTYQYVRDMYSHYIPLRGWDGTTADQVWDYVGGGKGAFNQTLKTAHGRTSIADDPIAYIENMAESGILLNNKNWVKQHLMLLAQNHPTSLLTLSKAWYVKSTDANGNEEWIPATPQITSQMNSNQVKAAIDAFEQKMEQMEQTGDATQKRDGLNIAYPQTHSEEREHEVRVMKDGEEYVIYVNGDPQLAQAMNNTRAHRVREIQSGKLDRAAAWLGRKMAAAYTSLSPLFIPSNYFRDLTMTLASTAIREDAKYNYLLRKNLATSWNLGFMLRDYQNGKLREKVSNGNATPKEQMFYDFMMNGGETGFVSSLDVEDLKKKFKNDLKDLDRWKTNPVKVGHTIMDIIEFLNRAIEDSNRFAIYMTSIQYGRSIDDAVNDAKNVTLNFNRKGTGEYGWQMIRNLYLFINPAVQSLQTLGALAKHHPFKFTAVTASWLASGVLVPIVNAALMSLLGGDDDKDKYWQFTKWDRRNNLIMWVPFTHEYVKIPLAQEFRAFYGVGDMIASKMMGGELAEESWSQYAEDLLGQVVDMLPLDPTGYDGNIAVSLMPNAIRPVFELAFNVDFTGKPLFKDTEYNKYDPNFTKAYVGTPDWLVRASRMMNSIGNDYPDVQQNKWDALGNPRYNLNNPGVVDHVLSSYLGGAYTMGSQVLGLLTKSLNDPKEIKVADIPLFSKFVSNPDDRPVSKKQGDEFWDKKEYYDRASNTISKLKKQAKIDGDYSLLERFYGSEEYKTYKLYEKDVKDYKEERKKERAEESGDEYRPHQLNAEDIYNNHTTSMDEFEDMKMKQLFEKLNSFKNRYDAIVDNAPSQSDGYYNANKAAIDAIDEVTLDKQEISELKKGFLDDGKDAYNAEDMKRIRELRKKVLSVLDKANKVVVANQKAKAKKK